VEIADQQPKTGPSRGDDRAGVLGPVPTGWMTAAARGWALVRPLGPNSRFGRLRWGGPCVNCGEMVAPGGRGWIEPTLQLVLCEECWPG
jgi:hypothetical protein